MTNETKLSPKLPIRAIELFVLCFLCLPAVFNHPVCFG